MDASMARLAREKGCRHCCFFNEKGSHDAGRTFGACQVQAPRTSSHIVWPIVDAEDWCGLWVPIQETH